jgi:hypothetical protein
LRRLSDRNGVRSIAGLGAMVDWLCAQAERPGQIAVGRAGSGNPDSALSGFLA